MLSLLSGQFNEHQIIDHNQEPNKEVELSPKKIMQLHLPSTPIKKTDIVKEKNAVEIAGPLGYTDEDRFDAFKIDPPSPTSSHLVFSSIQQSEPVSMKPKKTQN